MREDSEAVNAILFYFIFLSFSDILCFPPVRERGRGKGEGSYVVTWRVGSGSVGDVFDNY